MNLTRRQSLTGIAGILAAGVAPAAVVRSMIGARGVATSGGRGCWVNPYSSDGLLGIWMASNGWTNPSDGFSIDTTGLTKGADYLEASTLTYVHLPDGIKNAIGIASSRTGGQYTTEIALDLSSVSTRGNGLFVGGFNSISSSQSIWMVGERTYDRNRMRASESAFVQLNKYNDFARSGLMLTCSLSSRIDFSTWIGDLTHYNGLLENITQFDGSNWIAQRDDYTQRFWNNFNFNIGMDAGSRIKCLRIYNKWLTDQEQAANRSVDISLLGV